MEDTGGPNGLGWDQALNCQTEHARDFPVKTLQSKRRRPSKGWMKQHYCPPVVKIRPKESKRLSPKSTWDRIWPQILGAPFHLPQDQREAPSTCPPTSSTTTRARTYPPTHLKRTPTPTPCRAKESSFSSSAAVAGALKHVGSGMELHTGLKSRGTTSICCEGWSATEGHRFPGRAVQRAKPLQKQQVYEASKSAVAKLSQVVMPSSQRIVHSPISIGGCRQVPSHKPTPIHVFGLKKLASRAINPSCCWLHFCPSPAHSDRERMEYCRLQTGKKL